MPKTSSTTNIPSRERGTPRTLLKLYVVLPLVISISVAVSTALSYNLFDIAFGKRNDNDDDDSIEFHLIIAITAFTTLLGTLACLCGVIYGSVNVFSACFSTVVVVSYVGTAMLVNGGGFELDCLIRGGKIAFPSLFAAWIIPVLSKTRIFKSDRTIISRFVLLTCQVAAQRFFSTVDGLEGMDLLTHLLVVSFGIFALDFVTVSLILTGSIYLGFRSCCMNFAELGGQPAALSIFALIVASILGLFYFHRQHKNGTLSYDLSSITRARCCVIALVHCSQNSYLLSNNDYVAAMSLFGVILGAFSLLALAIVFAAVGDSWEGVGSNQWQMTSVDTLFLCFHFVFPIVLLVYRATDKYNFLSFLQDNFNHDDSEFIQSMYSLSLILTSILGVGLPLLNSLSPVGAFLFSRAYQHGQPSTRKVAIIVKFSDIIQKSGGDLSNLITFLQKTGEILNIFVSLDDMRCNSEQIVTLSESGVVELGVTTNSSTNESWSKSSDKVIQTHKQLSNVWNKKPSWYLSSNKECVHPSALRSAHLNCEMRTCFWSVLYDMSKNEITEEVSLRVIEEDILMKGGGSIIYVAGGYGEQLQDAVIKTIQLIQKLKYNAQSLSVTVTDDLELELRHRERIGQ